MINFFFKYVAKMNFFLETCKKKKTVYKLFIIFAENID